MKRAKRTIIIIGLALASCRGPVYSPTATPQVVSVRIMATTTAYPLLQDFATSFEQPDALLSVNNQAANWDLIYSQMQAGTVPYALTSYLPDDVPLWVAPVASTLVIVVHPAVAAPPYPQRPPQHLPGAGHKLVGVGRAGPAHHRRRA